MNIDEILEIKQFKTIELKKENNEIIIIGEIVNSEKTCPSCNKIAIKPHQYHKRKVRTIPFNKKPTYLAFKQTAYLCPSCGKRFLERINFLEKCQRKTVEYEKYVYELAKKQDISRVAELENLDWSTVNDIFLKGREKEGKAAKKCKY